MTLKSNLLPVAALAVLVGVAGPGGAQAATLDAQFSAAIERLLKNMSEGPVAEMDAEEKAELITCVQQVMSSVPAGKKRYVVEASGHDELRARFDEIGNEDHAALKQEITRSCG